MRSRARSMGHWCMLVSAFGLGCGPSTDEIGDPSLGAGGDVDAGGSSGSAKGIGGSRATGGSSGSGGARAAGGSSGTGGSGTGGSARDAGNAGGSAGSGGQAPRDGGKVFACDQLPTEGTWEQLTTPAGLGASAVGCAVDPRNPGTVYAGTSSPNGLWKSTDCGATWASSTAGANGSALTQGSQWFIRIDPVTSDVYVPSAYGTGALYKSTNGGTDWQDVSPKGTGIPGFVQQLAIDPTDHNHLVLTFHANCGAPNANMCMAESHDAAATWRIFAGPTGGWGEAAGPMVLDSTTYFYGAPFDGLYTTTDSGKTWQKPVGYAGCFAALALSDGAAFVGCMDNTQKTTDGGRTWSKVAGSPPAGAIETTGKYLYAAYGWGSSYYRAPLSDVTSWTKMSPPPGSGKQEPSYIPYDSAHHVMYSSNYAGGLWRFGTQ